MIKFNAKELIKLSNDIIEISNQYERFLYKFLLDAGLRAMAQTKALTPVDTGNLRNSWFLSSVYRDGDNLVIDLLNSAQYAWWVEYGHWQDARWVPGKWVGGRFEYIPNSPRGQGMMLTQKWVQGHYMAQISINKIEREMPQRFDAEFKLFLKKFDSMKDAV